MKGRERLKVKVIEKVFKRQRENDCKSERDVKKERLKEREAIEREREIERKRERLKVRVSD